jgi:hypothetical protein
VVERTTKRTTRSTTSAAIPTRRDGSCWIRKEWTFNSGARADKLDRHIREQVSWCDLTAVISMKPAGDFESLLVEIKPPNQPWLAKW